MTCIVFETPGEIDIRAFTLMGVSAKPNSANPIGYFGTGLKYAMATLVRLGAEPVVWIGKDKYTFFKRDDKFRGADFEKLSMRRESFRLTKSRVTDLPYAVSYGRNWEAWMAFRELESNTRDEGGVTRLASLNGKEDITGQEDRTKIVVELPAFTEAYNKRDEVFLPDAQREGAGIQMIDRPSEHLYWRGLKVYKLPKPSLLTYNFLTHLDLTEDRTLGNIYYARIVLAQQVLASKNEVFIQRILQADDKFWEHELDFPAHVAPGPGFIAVMNRYPKRVSSYAHSYYRRYDERVTERTFMLEVAHPFPWEVQGSYVVDANGTTVFEAPYNYSGKWDLVGGAILRYLNPVNDIPEAKEEDHVLHEGTGSSDYGTDAG